MLVVYVLGTFPALVANVAYSGEFSRPVIILTLVVPVILPLSVGGLLIWLPQTIARAMSGGNVLEPSTAEWGALQAVLFGLLGLYLTLMAILDLSFYYALHRLLAGDYPGASVFDSPEDGAGAIVAPLQLALGVVLLIGARGLSKVLDRLRNWGTSTAERARLDKGGD